MKNIKTFNDYSLTESINENSDNKFNYMMLGRLQSDCEYFLGHGSRSTRNLYYDTVDEHISEMKKLWDNLPEDGKPEWLTYQEIEEYEKDMLSNEE